MNSSSKYVTNLFINISLVHIFYIFSRCQDLNQYSVILLTIDTRYKILFLVRRFYDWKIWTVTAQEMNLSFKDFFSKCHQITFLEEIFNGKLHFLCSAWTCLNSLNSFWIHYKII